MAIHKKLEVGTILFTFYDAQYQPSEHRKGGNKYLIRHKALYVQNRRERSSGAQVPREMIPVLESLGIRIVDYGREEVLAIGCRNYIYHRSTSNFPYPSPEEVVAARKTYEEQLDLAIASNEGVILTEIPFMQEYSEKKMTNLDGLFSLQKPLQDFFFNETHL